MKHFLVGLILSLGLVVGCTMLSRAQAQTQAKPELTVYAATSVAPAVIALTQAFGEHIGVKVNVIADQPVTLRTRWQNGEPADMFVSSDTQNPAALAKLELSSAPVVWGRKRLVVVSAPGVTLQQSELPRALAAPDLHIGAGAPGLDEGGDLTWLFLERLDAVDEQLSTVLRQRIKPMLAKSNEDWPPEGYPKHPAVWLFEKGKANVLFLPEPDAQNVIKQLPGATILFLPESLSPAVDMAMVTAKTPSEQAQRMAAFLQSPRTENLLHRFGIAPAAR